jgi:hypothetical protein
LKYNVYVTLEKNVTRKGYIVKLDEVFKFVALRDEKLFVNNMFNSGFFYLYPEFLLPIFHLIMINEKRYVVLFTRLIKP